MGETAERQGAGRGAMLRSHLEERREEMVALLEELAAIESPSRSPAAQEPVFARLAQALAAAGCATSRLRGRTSGGQLFARPARHRGRRSGPSSPSQLLLGHVDTVWPVGTLAPMPVERRDGRLHGPGTYDMKAGLVQAVFALSALRALGLETPATPLLFVNSDEEVGSADSVARIRRLARLSCRVFVLEPSLGPEGRLKTARKGLLRLRVRAVGRAAHAGLDPERGASAILALTHAIQQLYALADPARGLTVNVGMVEGGVSSNVVAPAASCEVDVRLLAHRDAVAFEAAARRLTSPVSGTSLAVDPIEYRPPLETTPGNRALWRQALGAAEELGIQLLEGTAGGASDGNTTSLLTPTLDGLGAVGDGAHAAHEHVVIEKLPERAALLALLLLSPIAGTSTERRTE